MSKRTKAENEKIEERTAIKDADNGHGDDSFDEPITEGGFAFDSDFNVDEEYKAPALIPNGTYEGNVTNVSFDAAAKALVWDITLIADSDVLMSDNEMPVNGCAVQYKNWFPLVGDDETRTKNGKMTKRQAKINMIKEFSKKMRIDMNTPEAIMNGVSNAEWIGIGVIVEVEVREYEGRLSNQVKNIKAA